MINFYLNVTIFFLKFINNYRVVTISGYLEKFDKFEKLCLVLRFTENGV